LTYLDGCGEVWAPEIVYTAGPYDIYFSAGTGAAHRMYHISSATADSGYTAATKVALPDDRWAIDGVPFTFQGQRWFVWSGWAGDTNVEQNLYVARMTGPATTTGSRYVISQPREPWERVVGNPYIGSAVWWSRTTYRRADVPGDTINAGYSLKFFE
jgi:GH43 family beta-xylosidase